MKKIITTCILSVAILSALTACGNSAGSDSKSASAPSSTSAAVANGSTVTITATNFKYEPAEIHIKKGDTVTIKLTSKEGAHGFSVPDFNIDLNQDGQTATLTADKTGTFDFKCSVMCGAGHANMKGKIVVE